MRRAFVTQMDTAAFGPFPFAFAQDQPVHLGAQAVDLAVLPGHDVGQIVDHALQMGQFLFQFLHVTRLPGLLQMWCTKERGATMDIRVERHGRVQVVTLDRPTARNAVHPRMAQALFDVFRDFDSDGAFDVAILTGSGGAFCAGFDLKAAAHGDGAGWIDRLDIPADWEPVADPRPGPMGPTRLWLTKPVIAAVEGPAVAGGMELALWCDMRVVSETGYFGVFCRRWGVPLIDGGTVRLPRVVGQGRANDLILTGRKVVAAEAQAMGLADCVVPAGGALDAALELAQELSKLPQGCMRADHASARMPPEEMAAALRREWQSTAMVRAEGVAGAARFAAGAGRGGAPAD